MGFRKSLKRSKKQLSKNELKGYAWPKPIPHIHRKRKKKCGKIKYVGALLSKHDKSKNVRMYTFGTSTKDVWTDDDSYTISTSSLSSYSDRGVEEDPTFVCDHATGLQGLNLRQIRTSASSESFSSPSLSSYTASSDESSILNQFELRDDTTGVIIRMRESRESRDVPTPPLLPPPPRYISDSNTINADMNSDIQTSDTIHEEYVMRSEQNFEIRNKSLPKREIRRNASEGSRDFVHVFHQPLPPLEEDASLYSGDDADDELCDDDSSEHSPPRKRKIARRGSISSIEDEIDLRQRWEYGLAMMAQMGMNAVGNLKESSTTSITTLLNDNEYDEGNSKEI